MNEQNPSKRANSGRKNSKPSAEATGTEQASIEEMVENWQQDVKSLNYEESLQALDLLLAELQSDSLPVADLQHHYLHGNVYLQHCEALLNTVEQNVLELDPDTMLPNKTDA